MKRNCTSLYTKRPLFGYLFYFILFYFILCYNFYYMFYIFTFIISIFTVASLALATSLYSYKNKNKGWFLVCIIIWRPLGQRLEAKAKNKNKWKRSQVTSCGAVCIAKQSNNSSFLASAKCNRGINYFDNHKAGNNY